MFFSIAVPIYNAEKTVDRCIGSIIEQNEKDFELILVNDGSSDNSLQICREWEKKYPDIIRVIDKENTGSLNTRRRCITETKGDYLYIIDADDVICNKAALRIIKDEIQATDADLIVFPYVTDSGSEHRLPYRNRTVFQKEELKEIYKILLSDSFLNPLWNKVFSRDLIDWGNEKEYDLPLTNGTDLFQSIPIITNAKKIVYIDVPLYQYTMCNNDTSIIHKFKPTIYSSMKTNYLRLCEYSRKWVGDRNEYDRLLRRKMMMVSSTAASKVRLKNSLSKKELEHYLKEIAEDPDFRRNFSLRDIPLLRKAVLLLLYYRRYSLLIRMLR